MSITQPSNVWEATLLSDLTSKGTTSGVAVGQTAIVTESGLEGVYTCATAAAATSTWTARIVTTGTNVDIAGTLDVTLDAAFDAGVVVADAVGVSGGVTSDAPADANDLIVGDGVGDRGLTIFAGAANFARIVATDVSGTARGRFSYDLTNERWEIRANESTRAYIDDDAFWPPAAGWIDIGKTALPFGVGYFQSLDTTGALDVGGTLDVGGLATLDANARLESASPTLTVGDGTGNPDIRIDKVATGTGDIELTSAGVLDWRIRNGTGETLQIERFIGGAAQGNNILINNGTGKVDIDGALDVTGSATFDGAVTIDDVLNLDPQGSAPSGVLGDMYCNSAGTLHFHNGVSWKTVTIV